MNKPLLTTIEDGQPYVDDPIYLDPKQETVLAAAIREIFGHRALPRLLSHYEHVRLRWMKPGPHGKLVPR